MQEKKQKKIKASGTPAKLPCPRKGAVRDAGQFCKGRNGE